MLQVIFRVKLVLVGLCWMGEQLFSNPVFAVELKPADHSETMIPSALTNGKKEAESREDSSSLSSDQLVPDSTARPVTGLPSAYCVKQHLHSSSWDFYLMFSFWIHSFRPKGGSQECLWWKITDGVSAPWKRWVLVYQLIFCFMWVSFT